jgi:MFS transporter, DHA2 family, multidrug resistance protein
MATLLGKGAGFRPDLIGFGLIVVTFGCLEVVLDKGQEKDWFSSNFIVTFLIIAALGLIQEDGLEIRSNKILFSGCMASITVEHGIT